jgi:predicted dehydrogenase
VKFGLVGTGYWAQETHAPALAHESAVDFAAVWGRDPGRAAALAGRFGTASYPDYSQFLDRVDAVAFSVPPDAQVELAILAARAGKHLLLEKPIATSAAEAEALAAAVEQAGVSSVVNFTWRFNKDHRAWIAGVQEQKYRAAWARCISSALFPGSPYASSTWRKEKGALWDVTPHVLALLIPALGAVTGVTGEMGDSDLVHLIFHHDSGSTSTVSLTLSSAPGGHDFEFSFWRPDGISTMPNSDVSPEQALQLAVRELAGNAAAGKRSHPCDVHLGATIVNVLEAAEQSLASKTVLI